jgi:hypothetical protein
LNNLAIKGDLQQKSLQKAGLDKRIRAMV